MAYVLKSNGFELIFFPQIFESDLKYPVNTSLQVSLQSDGFCAHADMDISIQSFSRFAADLIKVYETLSGEARIEEPYGRMYISFKGNTLGHIAVEGYLHKRTSGDNEHSLKFENAIDQTSLRSFCLELQNFCSNSDCAD